MVVPYINLDDFVKFLNDSGCKVISNEFLDDYNRIIFEKDGNSFPLQVKKVYYFPVVVRLCMQIGIEPPEEHKRCYDQYMSRPGRNKGKKDES